MAKVITLITLILQDMNVHIKKHHREAHSIFLLTAIAFNVQLIVNKNIVTDVGTARL